MPHDAKHTKESLLDGRKQIIEEKKRRLLYIGVGCIVSVIVLMWAWNMIILIYNTTSQAPPSSSVDTIREDIQDIMKRNDPL